MKTERVTKKDVFVLGALYLGLLSIAVLLPETHPLFNVFVLTMYAVVGHLVIERVK